MDWNNLRNMKCPSCGERLTERAVGYSCTNTTQCDYKISFERFASIINKMYKPKKDPEDDPTVERNRDWLNAL